MRVAAFGVLVMAAGGAHAFCFEEAGALYNVNPELLRGIAVVESGMNASAMNMTHLKRTKSYDIGAMQINSGWLPTLERFGITKDQLVNDACTNVKVGAWILARTFAREGASWNGVGAYNAVCTQLKGEACTDARMTYANKVWRAMNRNLPKVADDNNNRKKHGEPGESRIASIDIPTASATAQADESGEATPTNF